MKKLFFIFFVLPTMLLSQSKIITGNVTDDTGEGLHGVTIQIKNSHKNGALTDFDGNFKITLSSEDDKVLIFSYLGFKRQEINVSNTSFLKIQLETDATQLDEVVVVGYGYVLKKDVTGALS